MQKILIVIVDASAIHGQFSIYIIKNIGRGRDCGRSVVFPIAVGRILSSPQRKIGHQFGGHVWSINLYKGTRWVPKQSRVGYSTRDLSVQRSPVPLDDALLPTTQPNRSQMTTILQPSTYPEAFRCSIRASEYCFRMSHEHSSDKVSNTSHTVVRLEWGEGLVLQEI